MFTRISNRKIHFKKYGKGPPLIMIHGWGGNLYSLLDLGNLASVHHTVFLLDLPGFGKSDNPPSHWGVEGYASMIMDFIKDQRLTKPSYFGHSFGGELGIFIAAQDQDLLDKLILCNSAYKREKKVSTLAHYAQNAPIGMRFLVEFLKPLAKTYYYRLFHRNSDLIKYPQLESNFRKIITYDITKQVPKVKNDTLIIWGEEDTYTPVHWAYELKKNIQGSQIYIVPKVGHSLPIKYPKIVWDQMKMFLKYN